MNSALKKVRASFLSSVNFIQTQFVPVRYRYYADRIAKGPYSKKFGYEDRVARRGVLPRLKDAEILPQPIYLPGGGKIRPPDISYDVPKWLRGRKGKEYRLLILKRNIFRSTLYEYEDPQRWFSMNRRIKYLYQYLNLKTKTGFSNRQ